MLMRHGDKSCAVSALEQPQLCLLTFDFTMDAIRALTQRPTRRVLAGRDV